MQPTSLNQTERIVYRNFDFWWYQHFLKKCHTCMQNCQDNLHSENHIQKEFDVISLVPFYKHRGLPHIQNKQVNFFESLKQLGCCYY